MISDLHGQMAALSAVLGDAEARGVDRLVCLGDVATLGPSPKAMLAELRKLGCTCIMGNHDAFLLDAALIHTYSEAPIIIEAVDWCRAQMSDDELDFVRGFEATHTIDLGGGATLLCYHGSPRSNVEDLLATTPPDEVDAMLHGHAATVMAGGHTHLQMTRQHFGTLLVNPGSVGLPFEAYVAPKPPSLLRHAEYAIVEATGANVSVSLHRVAVDVEARRAELVGVDFVMQGMLLAQLC